LINKYLFFLGEMDMNAAGKLCPTCQNENEDTASVCVHCGAWLEEHPTQIVAIPENANGQANAPTDQLESFIDVALIPEEGVGIYVASAFKAYYVQIYKELILGRPADATLEAVLDLSEANAGNMGVSRRHAKIRRTGSGFEVVDLSSRNGTWLNTERLAPNRPYPFVSGSQLHLGRMRLFVMYHPVLKTAKKS
jgi:hypothetical protein